MSKLKGKNEFTIDAKCAFCLDRLARDGEGNERHCNGREREVFDKKTINTYFLQSLVTETLFGAECVVGRKKPLGR